MVNGTTRCLDCNMVLPISEIHFYKNGRTRTGYLLTRCKPCHKRLATAQTSARRFDITVERALELRDRYTECMIGGETESRSLSLDHHYPKHGGCDKARGVICSKHNDQLGVFESKDFKAEETTIPMADAYLILEFLTSGDLVDCKCDYDNVLENVREYAYGQGALI